MAIRIRATTSGSFLDFFKGVNQDLEQAVTAGVRAAGEGMQLEMRRAVESVSPKTAGISKAIGLAVYPKNEPSLKAAASVWARGPSADRVISLFWKGGTVVPVGGRKYLAIPTGHNRRQGRRGGQVLVTPAEMVAAKGQTFVIPIKQGGGLLWCLRTTEGSRTTKGGRTKRLALAAGNLLGSGRRARTDEILSKGFVPMFILLSSVKHKSKFDAGAIAQSWADRVPGLIERATPRR